MSCKTDRRGRRGFAVLIILAAALPAVENCAFVTPGVRLTVRMPEGGGPWGGDPPSWEVEYIGKDGKLERCSLDRGGTTVEIETQRALNVPVAAYPRGRLKPAGAFVDHRAEGGEQFSGRRELRLSWEEGPAAEIFLALYEEPERSARVDAAYLTALMVLEGEGDPWSCDLERIRGAIVFRTISSIQVSQKEMYEAVLLLPESEWISDNPLFGGELKEYTGEDFRNEYTIEGSSCPCGEAPAFEVCFTGLYPGIHRFYSPAADLELHISMKKNGDYRAVCDNPRVFDR